MKWYCPTIHPLCCETCSYTSFEWKNATFSGGSKHTLTPPTYFQGGQDPLTPRIYAPGTMALSRVISEIFNAEKYRDLEIPVEGQSSHWHSLRLCMVSYYCFIVTLTLRHTFQRYSTSKCHDLENQVRHPIIKSNEIYSWHKIITCQQDT